MSGQGALAPPCPRRKAANTPAQQARSKERFVPIAVGEVHLEHGLRSLHGGVAKATTTLPQAEKMLVLARLHGAPLGLVSVELAPSDPRASWSAAFSPLFPAIEQHLQSDRFAGAHRQDIWEPVAIAKPSCCELFRATLQASVPASVVVATRDRPNQLRRCLDSLLRSDYPDFEVIVVDNHPSDDATRAMLSLEYAHIPRLRYVREEEQGLGAAHNRGLLLARGAMVAFTDDDVIVDKRWLTELLSPLVNGRASGSTGLIFPAELRTPAQLMLEAHGRFSKGFVPRLFDLGDNRPVDDRLFPFSAGRLGSGASMAFSAEYLRSAGGFDPALGTGTRARGGDDLEAIFRLLITGRTLAYQPSAIVWHHHRTTEKDVVTQARGYGVGLGAYLTSVSVSDPRVAAGLLARLVPAAAHAWTTTKGPTSDGPLASLLESAPSWPRGLSLAQRYGILAGPLAYLQSRRNHPSRLNPRDF